MKKLEKDKKYFRLKIISLKRVGKRTRASCVCVCGKKVAVDADHIKSGHTKSCGCLRRELHTARYKYFGVNKTPEFSAWKNMLARCKAERSARWYANIKVCAKWQKSYFVFLKDVGKRPDRRHSLDRIKSHKGYTPDNVRWTTRDVQSQNTKIHCTSKTKIRGVSFSKQKGKFRAHISVNSKSKHLGYFLTLKEAKLARDKAQKIFWRSSCPTGGS